MDSFGQLTFRFQFEGRFAIVIPRIEQNRLKLRAAIRGRYGAN
jgi:hypothetical protein